MVANGIALVPYEDAYRILHRTLASRGASCAICKREVQSGKRGYNEAAQIHKASIGEKTGMRYQRYLRFLIVGMLCVEVGLAANNAPAEVTLQGYVLDSACAFTKDLHKPISQSCARQCAEAGSPLVVLSDAGDVYWPISKKTPAEGQNPKLMPFAGKKVTVSGKVYKRGGSRAIAIEKIE